MKKRSKFYLYGFLVIFILTTFAGYLYLPQILGDTVYPLEYTNLIIKYSDLHKVPRDLTAAMIFKESRFNPRATSPVGARGLMQIMPPTGATIAKGVAEPNYNSDKLYDPETSIKFGTWYIHVMLERYNNNLDAALAAYNGGSGNADRWVSLGLLNNLPFGETRNYVKTVKEIKTVYAEVHGEELFGEKVELQIEKPKQSFLWGRMVKDLVAVFYGEEE